MNESGSTLPEEKQSTATAKLRELIAKAKSLQPARPRPDATTFPERRYDIAHWIDDTTDLFHRMGLATDGERVLQQTKNGITDMYARPLWTRLKRAELYNQIKQIMRIRKVIYSDPDNEKLKQEVKEKTWEAVRKIREKSHAIDEITRQYLTQQDVSVDLPEIGNISSRMVIIKPPESTLPKPPMERVERPVFLVSAFAGDLLGIASLAQEIALLGRTVIAVAQPESFMGQTNDAYLKAVSEDSALGPQTAFFEAVIKQVLNEGGEFDLYGYSMGGAIVGSLLHRPEMQTRVHDAVLMCPAGTVDQPFRRGLWAGIVHEAGQDLVVQPKRGQTMALSAIPFYPPKSMKPENMQRKKAIERILLHRICNNLHLVDEQMKVVEGGTITVFSGGEDEITKSYEIDGALLHSSNPQIRSVVMGNASHHTPVVDPLRVLDFIESDRV